MTRQTIMQGADPFSQAPLLAVLPVVGDIAQLDSYTSSLYARFEQVETLKQAEATKTDPVLLKRYTDESDMLRSVLDWLAIKPGG